MPLIESSFSIPEYIPLVGGSYGPFLNTDLRKGEQKQLFFLFFVSLVLIFCFGAWAYSSNKDYHEKAANDPNFPPKQSKEPSEHYNFNLFIGLDELIDPKSLMVGMGAGMVFGLIDNGGLWFGMDALDPIFEPSSVPWVYGYGGRRPYSGFTGEGDCIYYDVNFKDGVLERGEKIGGFYPHQICKKISEQYSKARNKIDRTDDTQKIKKKKLNAVVTNEAAFASPSSEMFLGSNMTKRDFFKYMGKYQINESTYNERVDNYRDYLNNKNLPSTNSKAQQMGTLTRQQKNQKLKYKLELRKLKKFNLKNLGFPDSKTKNQIEYLEDEIRHRRVWPGKNKKLAQSWMSGWTPGKLTQAGIGNTFSDGLGGFLATFAGVLILNMSQITNVSLISEVIGIIIGCIIGVILPRTLLYKLSYKT